MVKNLIPWKKKSHEVEVLSPNDDPTFNLTRGMADMVNQLFRPFNDQWSRSLFRNLSGFTTTPNIDVEETDKEVRVTADLPGLEEKDVQIDLDEHFLTLRGERKDEREKKGKNFHHIERSYGAFHRSIALPDGIDRDNVNATFKKGVLKVTIGKLPGHERSVRRIPVKSE
jgi:HSP20 family protein